MYLSEIIDEFLQALEERGDLEVICWSPPDEIRDITDLFISGDGQVCISSR